MAGARSPGPLGAESDSRGAISEPPGESRGALERRFNPGPIGVDAGELTAPIRPVVLAGLPPFFRPPGPISSVRVPLAMSTTTGTTESTNASGTSRSSADTGVHDIAGRDFRSVSIIYTDGSMVGGAGHTFMKFRTTDHGRDTDWTFSYGVADFLGSGGVSVGRLSGYFARGSVYAGATCVEYVLDVEPRLQHQLFLAWLELAASAPRYSLAGTNCSTVIVDMLCRVVPGMAQALRHGVGLPNDILDSHVPAALARRLEGIWLRPVTVGAPTELRRWVTDIYDWRVRGYTAYDSVLAGAPRPPPRGLVERF
jgi:hypothetical protein